MSDQYKPPPEYQPDEEPSDDFPTEEEHDAYFGGPELRSAQQFERDLVEQAVEQAGFTENYEPELDPPDDSYARLLNETREALRDANHKMHDYMMALPNGADREEWKELYILTSHIYAIINTIDMLKRHAYPPF